MINQNISVDGNNLESLKANMILDKMELIFSKNHKTKQAKEEEKVQPTNDNNKEETKPWNINLSNLKLNNSDFTF